MGGDRHLRSILGCYRRLRFSSPPSTRSSDLWRPSNRIPNTLCRKKRVDRFCRVHNQEKVVGREETLSALLAIDASARLSSTGPYVALVSGKGVDLKAGTFSLAAWISSPGSLPFVIGALLIGIGLAPVFYSLPPFRKLVLPVTAVGILVSILSFYLYSPSLISSWVVIPILLTLAAALLYLTHKTDKIVSNKAIFISLLSIIIFSLQFLIYPSMLGQVLPFDAVTTTGPMASAYLTITLIGTPLLVVMLAFYMTIATRGKERVARMKA